MTEPKRVLLVEDSDNDAELALAAFEQVNLVHEVVRVKDGEEALDYLYRRGPWAERAEGDPAVVLLDLETPRLGGLEVLERVKSDPSMRSVPIVMLTSSTHESDLSRSYELGANAYVVKPLDVSRFAEALKELVLFWAVVNHPPPGAVIKDASSPNRVHGK